MEEKEIIKEDISETSVSSNSSPIYISKEYYEKIKKELENLKTLERKRVAERIKEAKSFGDLSENAEYEEAKKEQAFIEGKILSLENEIERAVIIDLGHVNLDEVSIGCKVTVEDVDKKKQRKFIIVGNLEGDPASGRISFDSPVGKSLFGKKIGEFVVVKTPKGKITYKIVNIEKEK